MIKQLFVYAIMMACTVNSCAQSNGIKPLAKGNHVPDVSFKLQKNKDVRQMTLRHFKGKLVLIDFWGVYCTNCINSLPHLLELQKQFQNKIQILLVTSDSDLEIGKLRKKLKQNPLYADHLIALDELSVIHSDSVFCRLFPYEAQPTHVWIDEQQIFLRMTNGSSTTETVIDMYLKGEHVSFDDEQKLIGFDKFNPLSWIGKVNEIKDAVQYYSFIVKGPVGQVSSGIPLDYTPTSVNVEKDSLTKSVIGLSCLNNPIISLYKIAYQNEMPQFLSIPLNRIIIDSDNPVRFFYNKDSSFEKWAKSNTFSYALKIPVEQAADFYKVMQQDLDRHFKLESRVEKKKMKCLVLKKVDSLKYFLPEMEQAGYLNESTMSGIMLAFRNVRIGELVNYIKNNISAKDKTIPFFNETNYTGSINMLFQIEKSSSSNGIVFLQQELTKYGLSLNYEFRDIEILVIKDKR